MPATTKTNEIPMFAPLLDGLADTGVDLAQAVVTADALHSQHAHAQYPHSIGAEFVLTIKGNQPRLFAALGVTSLPTTRATPTDIATLVREHWGIESPHWLRDTLYREDNSTVHTTSGPRVMAALRNLAIGTTRSASRNMHRPCKILTLTS